MSHPKSEDFGDYYWVERFYEKMVEFIGQDQVDLLEAIMEEERQQESKERREKILASGWEEVDPGVYVSKL